MTSFETGDPAAQSEYDPKLRVTDQLFAIVDQEGVQLPPELEHGMPVIMTDEFVRAASILLRNNL